MSALLALVLLFSPEAERMLLGPSPFFRREGAERALRDGDRALLFRAAAAPAWDARLWAVEALGPGAPPLLLEDPVAAVREAAVRALDRAAPSELLHPLLADPDDAVRAAAAWALRGRAKSAALRPLLKDPWESVRMAALAASGDERALRRLAASNDPAEAVPALAALARLEGPSNSAFLWGEFEAALKRAERGKGSLFTGATPHAEFALARAVGDAARREASSAVKGISERLLRALNGATLGGDETVLFAEAVAGARDPVAARRLLDALLNTRARSARPDALFAAPLLAVLHAFSREPWAELAPLLLPLLEHKDPFVRLAVVAALPGNAALPALRDADGAVRAAACGRVERLESLLEMARDKDPRVLRAVARALGRAADARAGLALELLLAHPDAEVRRAAVAALLRTPLAERAARLARAALEDDQDPVRAAAAAALALLDERDSIGRAIEALAGPTVESRRRALALLEALTSARHEFDPARPAPGLAIWRAWWARLSETPAPGDSFRYHVEDLRRRGLDLVLVLDATGSMTHLIQGTKRRMEATVRALKEVVPDLRLRVVAYRDKGDAFVTFGTPFTHDARLLEDFLAGIPASGGGDPPEAVLAGLREAIRGTPWRGSSQRVVLLFADAPPHPEDKALLEATLREFKGTVHAVDVSGFGFSAAGFAAPEPDPGPPGPDFLEIARWGRGSAVRLSEESDLLRNLLVLALGPAHRAALETLFQR
ncbi:MAG: vWA domain-containing protein [Planctomycetaceae bacterium]